MPQSEEDRLGVLAATMGRRARVYHCGFVVPDLDAAIAALGPALGVTFLAPMEMPFPTLETPDGPRPVALRLSYSAEPAHIELIGTAPGSLWDFADRYRGHHIGVWSDDIAAESDRLESLGLRRLWWVHGPDGRLVFTYHDTPYGFYVELVDGAMRAVMAEAFGRAIDDH